MSLDVLAAFLKTVGAFQTPHSGRTLGHHLLGTYGLLADAGCDETTCLAGGLHSIYGTRRFKTQLLEPYGPDCERVTLLFGHRVEEIVFWFGEVHTLSVEEVLHRDPDDGDYLTLALITAANILEQGGNLDRWPRIKQVWEDQCARANADATSP